MSVKNLLDPILEQGIRNTNFFEGRLLSGDDLRNQLDANRQHDRYLGQAVGQGIINGLEVELDNGNDGSDGKPPIVTVKKGLAINAEGEVIGLPDDDIKLALSRSIKKPVIELADFYACAGPPSQQHVPNGVGVYILVMSPVAGYKERALKSGLGDEGIAKGCGSKYIQEGVEFRLVELTVDMIIGLNGNSEETKVLLKNNLLNEKSPVLKGELSRMSMLKNILAHISFGTEKILKLNFDVLIDTPDDTNHQGYGFIDEIRSLNMLSLCDVPLAIMYWSLDGIGFVDMWSVRRMLYKERCNEISIMFLDERRRMESYAMYRQFQNHISQLIKDHKSPGLIKLKEYFSYIPPAAVLPLDEPASYEGINKEVFFDKVKSRGSVITQLTRIQSMLMSSFNYLPIKLSLDELIWIYEIQENQNGYINGVKPGQRFLFVSTGYMPFYAYTQFDLARWDFGNYEPAIKYI